MDLNITLKNIKLNINIKKIEAKISSSNQNEALQFLESEGEDFYKWATTLKGNI